MSETNIRRKLAVLMTAYKAERTIREAVGSILRNTAECDIIIVDDCSPVPVATALGDQRDKVEIIRLEKNSGPGPARNIGIAHILARNYAYVAIMDADDIALPTKLAKQIAFLDQHPDIGAVGTWARFFDETTGKTIYFRAPPSDPDAIRKAMFFNLPMVHPSSMIRLDALRGIDLYDDRYRTAEDYELLRRLSKKCDLANLPEHLFDYRMSTAGQSLKNRRRQLSDRLRIQWEYFEPLQWRAWAGIAQTLALFIFPSRLLLSLKGRLYPER